LVPYGIDTDLFRPLERQIAREALGLPMAASVVFFSAVSLASERKGWPYLRQALERLQSRVPRLVLLTAGDDVPGGLPQRLETIHLGHVANDRLLRIAYNAADVFAGASLAETFGQVFLEASACGVPAVAFDTTGVRDVIRHGETGWLAPCRDAEGLADALQRLFDAPEQRERMGRAGRERVLAEFTLERQARDIESAYMDALADKQATVTGERT